MARKPVLTHQDLTRELETIREIYPKLTDDNLFVLWFLRAFITEDIDIAVGGHPKCAGYGHLKGVQNVPLHDMTLKYISPSTDNGRRADGEYSEDGQAANNTWTCKAWMV